MKNAFCQKLSAVSLKYSGFITELLFCRSKIIIINVVQMNFSSNMYNM